MFPKSGEHAIRQLTTAQLIATWETDNDIVASSEVLIKLA